MERIYINKDQLIEYEKTMRIQKHLDRYFMIRQFCYGKVIDCACGVGYGSYIIQTNQDVSHVFGLDTSSVAIQHAIQEFSHEKITFKNIDMTNFSERVDVLVSIETIEHIENPKILSELAERCEVKDIIISFPTKKSTHFNPFHIYDFYSDDIKKIFYNYKHVNTISIGQEVDIMFFSRSNDIGISAPRRFWGEKNNE